MKRLLIFRPSLGGGGADRVTAILLRRLDRSKFRLELALVRAEGAFLPDVPGDVDVHALSAKRLSLAIPALARLIRRLRPDIVFSTASSANPIAVIAHAIAGSKARLVLSERSTLYRSRTNDLKQRLGVALKYATYRRAKLVTAVSNGVADQLVTVLGLSRESVKVVYNPIVEEDLSDRAGEPVDHPWFASESPPVILACGRLVELKDYPTLLAAFAKVRARTRVRLFVLGDGPLLQSLRHRAEQLGVDRDVRFHGFDKNPFKYMARSRLLLHASRVEGLPGALIQAMACGTPVVSTDCDFGPREVISRPSVDGFLVPIGDADGLADRVLPLLNDDALHRSVGAAARASVARFSVAASLARYEAALEA